MDPKPTDRNDRGTRAERDEIDRRFLDEGAEGEQEILDAANDAFVEDQRDPRHPSRVERSHGADDPSHSRGSTRRRAGED